jgi:uncharacterized protein (DUF4415 family)
MENNKIREEYDLSKMKSRPNPYAKHLKREITINTDISVIEMAQKNGLSYQNLINHYLKDFEYIIANILSLSAMVFIL